MADSGKDWERGEAPGPSGHRFFPSSAPVDPGTQSRREAPAGGLWRKPGGGAVPTRPVESFFDFSADEPPEHRSADSRPESLSSDPVLPEARRRAFALLDEWLAWTAVVDDDRFGERNPSTGSARYRFVLDEPLADPGEVVRYSLRVAGPFL